MLLPVPSTGVWLVLMLAGGCHVLLPVPSAGVWLVLAVLAGGCQVLLPVPSAGVYIWDTPTPSAAPYGATLRPSAAPCGAAGACKLGSLLLLPA